jgi:Skp family chaperone for outer membrane proteins
MENTKLHERIHKMEGELQREKDMQDKNKQEIDILKDHKVREMRKNKVAEEEKIQLQNTKKTLEDEINGLKGSITKDQE